MEKEFIPYEQALALKELEFNEPCFGYYLEELFLFEDSIWEERNNTEYVERFMDSYKFCTAMTYQQAFRWFREKHKLPSYIGHYGINGYSFVVDFTDNRNLQFRAEYKYYTYEEAELECLKKLIEIAQKE